MSLTSEIYYTSRTHTQLRQLTSELLKTSFTSYKRSGEDDGDAIAVSMVPLGSRKQLCINEKVRALAKNIGNDRMNEACLDMQKSGGSNCTPAGCALISARQNEVRVPTQQDG